MQQKGTVELIILHARTSSPAKRMDRRGSCVQGIRHLCVSHYKDSGRSKDGHISRYPWAVESSPGTHS